MNLHRKWLTLLCVVWLFAGMAQAAPKSEYNKGVEAYRNKDYAAARMHWTKAMKTGEISAYNNLGFLLFQGLGGEADQARAVALWKKAAMNGHAESQWHLASAYFTGEGTAYNLVHAFAWYRCAVANAEAAADSAEASDNGKEERAASTAARGLAKVLDHMTAQEFEEGSRLAKQFIKLYLPPGPIPK